MKRSLRTGLRFLILLVLIPLTLYLCAKADRKYYLSSLVIIVLTLSAFFLHFENRRPQAREMVVLAVMSALAVASRAVFAAIPHFKPMMGIVMLTGIAFGPEAGFLCGAVSGFVSNFIFGQGPWTPWQMFAYGVGGLLAGLFAQWGILKKVPARGSDFAVLGIFGFLSIVLIVGPLLDTSTLFMMVNTVNSTSAAAIYLSGLPVNLVHGVATLVTVVLAGRPLLEKLQRIQIKYGMME
ncbi:MAG: ECF transporter S component [Eubacteriales bacterium]|nr:ECF transporter S component [Eubacteriales bacterium]